jgi:hypothetical protein
VVIGFHYCFKAPFLTVWGFLIGAGAKKNSHPFARMGEKIKN